MVPCKMMQWKWCRAKWCSENGAVQMMQWKQWKWCSANGAVCCAGSFPTCCIPWLQWGWMLPWICWCIHVPSSASDVPQREELEVVMQSHVAACLNQPHIPNLLTTNTSVGRNEWWCQTWPQRQIKHCRLLCIVTAWFCRLICLRDINAHLLE